MGAMSATATLAGFLAEALAVDGRNAEAIEIWSSRRSMRRRVTS